MRRNPRENISRFPEFTRSNDNERIDIDASKIPRNLRYTLMENIVRYFSRFSGFAGPYKYWTRYNTGHNQWKRDVKPAAISERNRRGDKK
jgi:hypothetical protein